MTRSAHRAGYGKKRLRKGRRRREKKERTGKDMDRTRETRGTRTRTGYGKAGKREDYRQPRLGRSLQRNAEPRQNGGRK